MPLLDRVLLYLNDTGAKIVQIGAKIGASRGVLSYWLNGRRHLPRKWVKPLDDFLSTHGY